MLDLDIAVLGPAERLETLAKCNDPSQHFGIILGVWMQECDAPHPLALLRPRRERPRRRATNQRDEVAPCQWIEFPRFNISGSLAMFDSTRLASSIVICFASMASASVERP